MRANAEAGDGVSLLVQRVDGVFIDVVAGHDHQIREPRYVKSVKNYLFSLNLQTRFSICGIYPTRELSCSYPTDVEF